MFGSFGWMELVLILIIVLIIFGAGKLPQLGEGLGKAIKGFKKTVHEADAIDVTPEDLIQRLRGFFSAGRLRIMPRAGVRTDTPQPIFVLGFPRSGTTLVEQTLSAHPRIRAGDELPLMNDISALMPRMLGSPLTYPEALVELVSKRKGGDTITTRFSVADAKRAGVHRGRRGRHGVNADGDGSVVQARAAGVNAGPREQREAADGRELADHAFITVGPASPAGKCR